LTVIIRKVTEADLRDVVRISNDSTLGVDTPEREAEERGFLVSQFSLDDFTFSYRSRIFFCG